LNSVLAELITKTLDLSQVTNFRLQKKKKLSDTNFLVLTYHQTSGKMFRKHVSYLKSIGNIVSIDTLYHRMETKIFSDELEIVLSFDDGHRNFYEEIYPVVSDEKIPLVHYITTGYVDLEEKYWWEKVADLKKFGVRLNAETIKNLHHEERSKLISSWEQKYSIETINASSMTSVQIKKISESKYIIIGSHTCNHPNLKICTREELLEEITTSKSFLEVLIRKKVDHFAYPNGDYNEETIEAVKLAEYKTAMAVHDRWISQKDNLFEIPRIGTGPYGASVSWLKYRISRK